MESGRVLGSLAGEGKQICDKFGLVPTRRLIVLGAPGAGKTVLLMRLVRDLVARRENADDPVPVLLSLASWNPDKELREWLVSRLLVAYPHLKDPAPIDGSNNIAEALLEQGLILPVLDGLEEIAHEVRGKAIGKINEALRPGEGIVLQPHRRVPTGNQCSRR